MTNIRWRARYSDGSYLDQIDGTSVYPTINRKALAAFDILDLDRHKDWSDQEKKSDKYQLVFRMWIEKGQTLIYRYRPRISIVTGKKVSEFWMIGHKQKINGRDVQVINYIFPDGHVEQAGKWLGGVPVFKDYEVET